MQTSRSNGTENNSLVIKIDLRERNWKMNKSIIINQVLNDCVECGTINNHRIIEKCIKKVFQVLNFNNDKK